MNNLKLSGDLIEKVISYGLIAGFAVLSQLVADRDVQKTAYNAAANAVVNVLNERAILEQKANAGSQAPHHIQ